jgi:hypothetical protein
MYWTMAKEHIDYIYQQKILKKKYYEKTVEVNGGCIAK